MKKTILPLIAMALLVVSPLGVKAQTSVENYVSASGVVVYHAPSFYSSNSAYAWDFEDDFDEGHLRDWSVIDADVDGYNWNLFPQAGLGHYGSNGVVVSYSYDNNYNTALHPNNYLVSPRVTLGQDAVINFWACGLDESYAAEHFGVAISTTVSNDPSAFTMLHEWTLTAKNQPGNSPRNNKGDRQGNWYEWTVDLGQYAGQDVYLAIVHFNCTDQFAICVDDISIDNGNTSASPLVGCDIILDGQTVAQNQKGRHYLLNTANFADNSNHTTTVRAHYQSGETIQSEYAWTYRTPDHFLGAPGGLEAKSDGDRVQLSWALPTMSVPFPVDELFYDFADSTLMDLTLIDANNDGQNFRVYPYSGYNGGIGLRSFSWMAGANNLYPDNYIVTPRLTPSENGIITFMARDADMPGIAPDPEHFGVAVSTSGNTNPNDFTMIAEWNSTGAYTEYTADLSAYAGQQIYVAIRHFNTTGDCYFLCVDDIKLTGIEANVTRNAIGAALFANGEMLAMLHHGEISFTHDVNRYNSEYSIRIIQDGSRETGDYFALAAPQSATVELNCIAPKNLAAHYDGEKVTISWEREIFIDFENDPEGWAFLDADGDGYVFGIYSAGGMNSDGSVNTTGTNASLTSFSFINGQGGLHPDNYAFMPLIKVMENAKMSFYAAGFDPSYAVEHFGVAVASSDGQQIATIAEFDSRNPYQRYEVDLSAYAGQEIYLGFRHFTNVANYALCIDNITVTNAVWAGTSSTTYGYYVYRSTNGSNYELIGVVTGSGMHFDDNDTSSETFYYQVTAINTIAGGSCESAPGMSADGLHDFVTIQTDGLSELEGGIQVYPNPTRGQVFVEVEEASQLTVMNALGQTVYETTSDAGQTMIDLSQYGAGIYTIRISSEKGVSVSRVSVVK